MSIGTKDNEPKVLRIANLKVIDHDDDIKIAFNLESGFAEYLNQYDLHLGLVPMMANEDVEFVLDCFVKLFGEKFFKNAVFKDRGEYVLGEYAINKDNNVFLSMDWNAIVEAMNPSEREKGAMDMLYFVAFQKFSKIGSCLSMVIDEGMRSQEQNYLC